jgi:peptidyl-prolyl cis-trans isomerase C
MKKVYMNQNVSDDEAYEFFIKNNHEIPQPDEIKIAEILTNDLDVVKSVFDALEKGISFSRLAEKYTLRDSLKNKGGEFEYEPADKEGILWETAAKMKVGEVYGPIMHAEGYSVIKLIDRKQKKKKMFETFEEARNSIKDILQTRKMYSSLDNITAELALGNNISIDENLLNSIKISPVNMIVFRRFGFGGQMNAVPYTPDFSKWYKTFENLKKKTAL